MDKHKKKKRKKKHYFLRFIVLVAIIASLIGIAHLDYFNVTEISVSGNNDVSDEQVLKLSEIKMNKSIFDAHPFLIAKKIEKNMFVENAKVKRELPGRIIIKIQERTGMGQFFDGNSYIITDKNGNILSIRKKESRVALVEGLKVKKAKEGNKINTSDDKAVSQMLTLIDLNEKNDLYFKKISIKGGKVNAHIYDNLVCIGKYDNMSDCIKSGVLKSVVYDLYQKGKESGTINVSTDGYCFFTPEK